MKLANWISTQRQEYKNLKNGRSSQLNEQRVRLLNDIGFAWEVQRGGRRRQLKPAASKAKVSEPREAQGIVPGKALLGGTGAPEKQLTKIQGLESSNTSPLTGSLQLSLHGRSRLAQRQSSLSTVPPNQTLAQQLYWQEKQYQTFLLQQQQQLLGPGSWQHALQQTLLPAQNYSFPSSGLWNDPGTLTPVMGAGFPLVGFPSLTEPFADGPFALERILARANKRSRDALEPSLGFPLGASATDQPAKASRASVLAANTSVQEQRWKKRRADPPSDPPESTSDSEESQHMSGPSSSQPSANHEPLPKQDISERDPEQP